MSFDIFFVYYILFKSEYVYHYKTNPQAAKIKPIFWFCLKSAKRRFFSWIESAWMENFDN